MIEERVFQVLECFKEEINSYEGDSMMDDGVINSLEIVGMVTVLEDEFGIDIKAKYVTAEYFATKETIADLVKKLLCGGRENDTDHK